MYLVISHIPQYVNGKSCFVTTEWKRSLLLLRDSLEGKLGPVTLLSPSMPIAAAQPDQLLEKIDEIETIPSLDLRGRARHFWLKSAAPWRAIVREQVAKAEMVHAGMDQLWKPIQFIGFLEGIKQQKPTVFVMDTDLVSQIRQLSQDLKSSLYTWTLDRAVRWSVQRASLALLKGQALYDRYSPHARNPHLFHDSSHKIGDVISEVELEARLLSFQQRQNLSLVYCGRFERRKGIRESLQLLRNCKNRGRKVTLDLIGEGQERPQLEEEVSQLELTQEVQFLGARLYGPALLKTLSSYDALLFTPLAEDTPRMLFDGFAAGLPLLGHAIGYSEELLQESAAGALWHTQEDGIATLQRLLSQREILPKMARAAHRAGLAHAADIWYRKRAEWTLSIR